VPFRKTRSGDAEIQPGRCQHRVLPPGRQLKQEQGIGMIARRRVVVGLTFGVSLRGPVLGQDRPKIIGALNPLPSAQYEPIRERFSRAMLDLNYVNGKHYSMVERLAEGRNERLPGLAEDLVKQKVDLILAHTTNAAAAARDATSSIPIVFFDVSDPVRAGFAESLGRPGRNMTGVSNFSGDLNAKRLELLKQVVPGLARVAALINPTNPYNSLGDIERVLRPAEQLGLLALPIYAASPEEMEPAFRKMEQQGAQAVLVTSDAYFWTQRQLIGGLTLSFRLPSIFSLADFVDAGGLMSYGVDAREGVSRAASYVVKILKGERPADLPVEQPTKVDLVINRTTAAALTLSIPKTLLLQAEKVVG
jgi:putative ABC transport system substrate-binding protein